MRLINRHILAAEAYEKWCKRYGDMMPETPVLIPWLVPESDKMVIANKLKELGPRPTPEQVNKVIGNSTWTMVPNCFHCGLWRDEVVEFQFKPMVEDEDENRLRNALPIHLCSECLLQALRLIEGD